MHASFRRLAALVALSVAGSVLISGGIAASGLTAIARATTSYTALTIDGEAGAPIGEGIPQVYTDADSTFDASDPGLLSTPGYILLHVVGVSGPAAGHWWYVHLAAPPGEDLAVGTYLGATRAAFRAAGEPGIDIYGDGVGCNTVAGQFTINQIAFSGPTLTMLSASYSFACDGLSVHTAGEVRFASSQGFAGLRQVPASAAALAFGSSNFVGVPSAPRTTQLVNAGTTAVGISAFSIDGANAGDFARSDQTCGTTLAPGEACGWDTSFTATASGSRVAAAHFTSDTHGFAHRQTLSGSADAAWPQLIVAPVEGKAFGTVTLGNGASQAFTFTSIGNVADPVGTRSLTGPDAADFEITGDDCPPQLAPTATCTITVRFRPMTAGPKTATLSVVTADAYSPYLLALSGSAVLPSSGVAWGTLRKPGPSYTWTAGGALGRTVRSGSQRLHLAYATDRIAGSWARDSGPRVGIYYVRSLSGSTWTTPKRLNPTSQHAARSALAASGSRVYVAWVSQTKIVRYSPTAPRVLYIRVNTRHGDSTAWRTTVRLTSTTGRVDYPSVAATGSDVIVTWTDSVSGSIRAAISHDRGVTWRKVTLGSTTVSTTSGRSGLPSVAVAGSTMAISWVSDAAGTAMTRISNNRGTSWHAAVATGAQANGYVSTAARGSRVAIAWTTDADVVVREMQAGVWGTPYSIATVDVGAGAFTYAPVVMLQDPARVGVGWAEQGPTSSPSAAQRWAESADDGAHWFATQTVGVRSTTGTSVNDWASVLWPTPSTRILAWNGWTAGTTKYRQFLRVGTGSPTTSSVATVWKPDRRLADVSMRHHLTRGSSKP